MKKVLGWWFSNSNKKLDYEDGRKVKEGRVHSIEGEIALCHNGLHASKSIVDAYMYGFGYDLEYIWRVELSGEMDVSSDKIAAQHRKYLWGFPATRIVHKWLKWRDSHLVSMYGRASNRELRRLVDEVAQLKGIIK